MSLAERKNASISVEFGSNDGAAIALGRDVERLWNGGWHDEALVQLDSLEARVGCVAIGNSWRIPLSTLTTAFWARDVRIGNRDSLLDVSFGAHDASGHLFAVLRHGSSSPHYSVCLSTDGGSTWVETYMWVGSLPTSLDAAVYRDHFYVAYNSPGENSRQVRLRWFLCSNGAADTFRTGASWIAPCTLDVGDTMREVSCVYGALHIYTLVSDGSLLWSWSTTSSATTWVTSSLVPSGAVGGLDATWNPDYDSTWFFFSYYDTTDTLRVYGRRSLRFSTLAGRGTPTCISACRDTVVCVYEDATSSPHRVRYVVNYDGGDTWITGTLSSPDKAADAPAVTVHAGGFAAAFRQDGPATELRFCQRTASGLWSSPVTIAENGPSGSRPCIKELGACVYGVAYLSDTSPVVGGAYFDRSDWPYNLAEQRRPPVSNLTPRASIVRGVLFLPETASPRPQASSLLDINGRDVLVLKTGANDVRGLVSGVYFVLSTPPTVTKVVVTR